MVQLYGKAPYKIVLVHGGPGAIGSLKGFAQKLSELSQSGVMEPLQSKYSIAELIEELYIQIKDNCSDKVSLVGHSWRAWCKKQVGTNTVRFTDDRFSGGNFDRPKWKQMLSHIENGGIGTVTVKDMSRVRSSEFALF